MRRRPIIIITLLLQLVVRLHGYQELSVGDDDDDDDDESRYDSSSSLHQILSVFLTDSDIDVSELKGMWPFNDTEIMCEKTKTRDTDYLKYGGYSAYDEKGGTLSVKSCGRNIFTAAQEAHNGNRQLPVKSGNSFDESSTSELRSRLEELLQEIRNSRRMRDEFWSRRRRSVKVESKDSRVVGGHASQDGSWPWLAAIGYKNRGPKCGGTLIADQWVITASHCFKDMEAVCQYNVRLGSRNWLYDNENTHVDSTVQAIFRHPKFDVKTMANDVALIKLSSPVKLDPAGFINAACLPITEKSVPTEAVCLAAGWGRLSETSRSHVLESREVEVSVLTYEDPCGDYKVGTMRPGMMCVGDRQGGHDTCQGDSGGPLMRRVDNRWTLIGITSFGEGCARSGYPGVYTDVGHHINWINSVIRRHS